MNIQSNLEPIPDNYKPIPRIKELQDLEGYITVLRKAGTADISTLSNYINSTREIFDEHKNGKWDSFLYSWNFYIRCRHNNHNYIDFNKWLVKNKAESLISPERLKDVAKVFCSKDTETTYKISCVPIEIYNHYSKNNKHFTSCFNGPCIQIKNILEKKNHIGIIKLIDNTGIIQARSWLIFNKDKKEIYIQNRYGTTDWLIAAKKLVEQFKYPVGVSGLFNTHNTEIRTYEETETDLRGSGAFIMTYPETTTNKIAA